MHFTALTLLATSMVAAALPSFDFLTNPSTHHSESKAPCLDQARLNTNTRPGNTLDFPFRIRNPKTNQFMGAQYINQFAPVTMGYPTVFTLNNGVLSPLDRDGEGNRLVVDMSPLRIFPPRLALWRINEDDDGPARFPVAVRGDEDGLFINSEKESTQFTAEGGRQGDPVVLLPRQGGNGGQDFVVIRV